MPSDGIQCIPGPIIPESRLELNAPALEEAVMEAIKRAYRSVEHRPSGELVQAEVRKAFREALSLKVANAEA